jgi:hypothetical protein
MKYILLLILVGFIAFWGGFGIGVDYEYQRKKDDIK